MLALVDAGMVDVMSEAEQENFIGLFKAMGSGDIFFYFLQFFLLQMLLLHGTLRNVYQVYHSKQEKQKRKFFFNRDNVVLA